MPDNGIVTKTKHTHIWVVVSIRNVVYCVRLFYCTYRFVRHPFIGRHLKTFCNQSTSNIHVYIFGGKMSFITFPCLLMDASGLLGWMRIYNLGNIIATATITDCSLSHPMESLINMNNELTL